MDCKKSHYNSRVSLHETPTEKIERIIFQLLILQILTLCQLGLFTSHQSSAPRDTYKGLFLRRRAKRDALLFASVFFRQNVTSFCISKSFGYFSQSLFYPRQFKIFKTESQLNALSGHARRFQKFSAWAILLA